MKIAIVDYESGNLKSVSKALESAGNNLKKKIKISVTRSIQDIETADKIILPGQGSFKQCYQSILSIHGLLDSLQEKVVQQKKYLLGICVGMQLFADYGDEEGGCKGFSWITGEVKKIKIKDNLKLPHMGWNNIFFKKASPLFDGIKDQSHFYFVHSYSFQPKQKENIAACTNYGEEVVVAVEKNNIFGTQFHPEKSQENGIKLLENFLKL